MRDAASLHIASAPVGTDHTKTPSWMAPRTVPSTTSSAAEIMGGQYLAHRRLPSSELPEKQRSLVVVYGAHAAARCNPCRPPRPPSGPVPDGEPAHPEPERRAVCASRSALLGWSRGTLVRGDRWPARPASSR